MQDAGTLGGKVAVVTGTDTEIGAAVAEALGRAGASVLLSYYGGPGLAGGVAERLRAAGGRAERYPADLSRVRDNQALVARALELWGRLDVFVANAGLTVDKPFLETTEADWGALSDLNLKGSFFGAQAAAKAMLAGGRGGRIVFSSSVTGTRALPGLSAYGVTKAGLKHMASTLGLELGPYGVTVNAVGIGATTNARNLASDPAFRERWSAVIPAGRDGRPEDVAAAVLFLASPGAAMVNGHTLMIDGGWTHAGRVP